MALATDEHGLTALFTCYLYYVVLQLFVLFVFVHYSTRACMYMHNKKLSIIHLHVQCIYY